MDTPPITGQPVKTEEKPKVVEQPKEAPKVEEDKTAILEKKLEEQATKIKNLEAAIEAAKRTVPKGTYKPPQPKILF